MTERHPEQLPFVGGLAKSLDPGDRKIWLRVACDHFVARPPVNAVAAARFAATMTAAIPTLDEATAITLGRKLAPCPQTPQTVVEAFLRRGNAIAETMRGRPLLMDDDDIAEAAGRDVKSAEAAAKRSGLPAAVVAQLCARDERQVLLALARNRNVAFTDPQLAVLVRRGVEDDELAATLLARGAIGLEHAGLFLQADGEQRLEILLAARRADLARPSSASSGPDREALASLEAHALARRPDFFVRALATAIGASPDIAERIADDPHGDSLAVALAALGAPGDVMVRILISADTFSGGRYRRIHALPRLEAALSRGAARRIIDALVGNVERSSRPHYFPIAARGTASVSNRAAAPAVDRKQPIPGSEKTVMKVPR